MVKNKSIGIVVVGILSLILSTTEYFEPPLTYVPPVIVIVLGVAILLEIKDQI